MNRTDERLTRQDVERIVAEARSTGNGPNLRYADLRDVDMSYSDLSFVDLRHASLRGADLRGANLRSADLRQANLRQANLRYADLFGADLRGSNLRDTDTRDGDLRCSDLSDANLFGVDLRGANLSDADLRGADLRDTNLRGADRWGGLSIEAGASGDGFMVPTPGGWSITIGCWSDNTLDDLRDLIEDRADWPEARGEERERRRPMLRAVLALCEAHIAQQPADLIDNLRERWGD